ncbi:MAG: 1-deoxy-D-xylulose-5-phosphate reductoisomerase [Gammaproteobacteria bacterium AqS3]|nr:1-deoxy-D-xylulose-5-phosphate reductoisomerase [Gammaproteobacteria bacterium AqS3]
MRRLCILGATGSIGTQTLDWVRSDARYSVSGLSAHQDIDGLIALGREFPDAALAAGDAAGVERVRDALGARRRILHGAQGLTELAEASDSDTVVAGIVGSPGLASTLAAVRCGKRVLLANKEALVMSGVLLLEAARESGAELIPIDSEHSALLQCLPAPCARSCIRGDTSDAGQWSQIARLWLTASGGPFWSRQDVDWAQVSVNEACAHPVWSMGRKISVDSATLVNKGLELIEASLLFSVPHSQVDVLVHPQGLVHALVEFADGSQIASLGAADMRIPIGYALAWPGRAERPVQRLDLASAPDLSFERIDARFAAVSLAREAMNSGQNAMIAYNAANEIAVDAFLQSKIKFDRIVPCIEDGLRRADPGTVRSIEDISQVQQQAISYAREWIA